MYDNVATLLKKGTPTFDKYGNKVETITERDVYVQPRGVYQSEFYNAAQLGLKPSITLVLAHRDEYEGEKSLEYEGKEYTVIRVDWNAQRDGLSLVCEERLNE